MPFVHYDTNQCQNFMETLLGLKSSESRRFLVSFWYAIAFGDETCDGIEAIVEDDWSAVKDLLFAWSRASLWNRQMILYQLVPVITEVILGVARHAAQLARELEPL